jgi:biotin operon repressor
MITNFEEITSPLTDDELLVADILSRSISKVTKKKPVNTQTILDKYNNGGIREELNIRFKLTDGRLRKIINHLRQTGVPVLSTAKGYYVSHDSKDILDQINSLEERASAIQCAADGLKKILDQSFSIVSVKDR